MTRGRKRSEVESQMKNFFPINEIFARFPHIGQTIFDKLDNQSLKQSREVHSAWYSFLSQSSFYWNRIAKSFITRNLEISDDWNQVFAKIPVKISKEFGLGIAYLYRFGAPGNLPTYFDKLILKIFLKLFILPLPYCLLADLRALS